MDFQSLNRLVDPHDKDSFLRRFWRKKVCHIPGDEHRFDDLFSWTQLSHLFNYGKLDPAHVQCSVDGYLIPPHELTKELPQFLRGLDSTTIQSYLNEAATLVIARIHEKNEALHDLCHGLSYEVGDSVIANLYASWPGVQGYDIHADDHALFVVQVEGVKEWQLFKPFNIFDDVNPSDYLEQTITLTKGDVLYIPRGVLHCAEALEPSMHITVGVYPRTFSEFVDWVVREVKKDPVVFNEMPMGIQKDPFNYGYRKADVRMTLENLKASLDEILTDKDMLDKFNRYCIGHDEPIQPFQFPHYGYEPLELNPDTTFTRKRYQKFRFKTDADSVSVFVWGKKMTYQGDLEPVIKDIFSKTSFTGQDLIDLDTEHDWERIKPVLENLVRWGIIHF